MEEVLKLLKTVGVMVIIIFTITICFFVFIGIEAEQVILVEEQVMSVETSKQIAEQYILDNHKHKVKLTTSQMNNANNDGKICFLIEAEGETDSIHNLFIVAVKGKEAELISQIF